MAVNEGATVCKWIMLILRINMRSHEVSQALDNRDT